MRTSSTDDSARAKEVRREKLVECCLLVTIPSVVVQSDDAIVSVGYWRVKHALLSGR